MKGLYNIFYFGWDNDCIDEYRNHRGAYSKVHCDVKEALKLQDRFQFAIIVDLETACAVQVTKAWTLKDSVPEKDVIRALQNEEE